MNMQGSLPSLKQSIYRLWWNLSIRRRLQFLLLALLMLAGALIDVFSLGAVFPFIGVLTTPETIYAIPVIRYIAGSLGITQATQLIFPLTLIFIGSSLLAGIFRLLVMWVSNRVAYATGHELSAYVYKVTLFQPYHVHVSRNSSEVISGISKVDSAIAIISHLLMMANSILITLFIIATLIIIDPLIASLTLLGFSICYVSVAWLTRRRLYKNGQRMALESSQRLKVLQEGLGGIRDVLLHGSQLFYVDIYRRSDWSLRHAQGVNAFLGGCPRYVVEALSMILIAVLAYGLSMQSGGLSASLPLLGALALGAQRLLPALQQIYASWTVILANQPNLIDALAFIEQPLPEHALLAPASPLNFQSEIQFENVCFQYTPNGPWVIDCLNLVISKGTRVGFVGSTGCGKSTALDLLMGLLIPTSGLIVVDGMPMNGETLQSWQRTIAHVPQSIFLSDTTIAENIAFGEPPEAIDMQRVRLAAKQSQISEFIESNPAGYSTMVGERGIRLSGGQRQRLGIARALYKQASVLVFDEATSALDNATEKDVMDAIEGLGRDLTIIIIAHRLSTVSNCDVIVYLDQGKIAAQGTFGQLLNKSHSFRNMVEISDL